MDDDADDAANILTPAQVKAEAKKEASNVKLINMGVPEGLLRQLEAEKDAVTVSLSTH